MMRRTLGIAFQLDALPASIDRDVRMAARIRVPVLITAETLNQREMCARLIHTSGGKREGVFVAFSVDAAQEDDETTLQQRFDTARGGTLFIDDITKLSPRAQTQLCRLVERNLLPQVRGLHGSAGVRVIAGASRHLNAECATGSFCETLFYRLNVVHIDLTRSH